MAIDTYGVAVFILFDLSGAYDTIDRTILLHHGHHIEICLSECLGDQYLAIIGISIIIIIIIITIIIIIAIIIITVIITIIIT